MVICPECGKDVREAKFCQNCGAKLPQPSHEISAEVVKNTKFCQNCGKKIAIGSEVCPYCGVRAMSSKSGEKNIVISAILSVIFPGLGHFYLNLNTKAISFIIAYIVSAILMLLLIGFVLVIVVWIWALIDVVKCTEAINNGEYVEDKLI